MIEKCLQINHTDVKNQMVKEILLADSYLIFLKDQYGNYVIQKTLAVAEKDDLDILISKIKPEMEDLKRSSEFGQKIYNKLVKTYPMLQNKSKASKKNKKRNSQKNQPKMQMPPGMKVTKGQEGQLLPVSTFIFNSNRGRRQPCLDRYIKVTNTQTFSNLKCLKDIMSTLPPLPQVSTPPPQAEATINIINIVVLPIIYVLNHKHK